MRVADSLEELTDIRIAWARLADTTDAPLYAAPFWCVTWWRHLGRGSMAVRVVDDGDDIACVLPLHGRRRAGWEVLRSFGDDVGAVPAPAVAESNVAAAETLWAELLGSNRRAIDLHRMRLDPASEVALGRLTRGAWRTSEVDVCPVVIADDVDSYLATRDSRLRRVLKRAPRLAADDGHELRTTVSGDAADVERLLPELDRLWDAAEAAYPRTHFLRGAMRGFTLDLLRTAAEEDRLALVATHVGDTLAASAFGYRVGRCWYYSGPRFDPAFQRYAPGHLTLRGLVEHALGRGDRLDLLLGGQDYKLQWSTGSYPVRAFVGAASARQLAFASASLRGLDRAQLALWRLRHRGASG